MSSRKSSTELRSKYRKVKLPNGSTRDEHRLVAEANLGRRLRRFEVVHHINGDKLDNRPENLEVMSLSAHSRLHADPEALRERALQNGYRPKPRKGSQMHNATISENVAAEAKRMLFNGATTRELAILFGVSRYVFDKIRQGKTWTHVAPAELPVELREAS